MKESKYSIFILGSILFANLIIILCVQNEDSAILKIFSASFGGVAVSWVVAIITYFAEERKSIYNFYVAADRYTEKLRSFSQYLVESNICIDKAVGETKRFEKLERVLFRLEKIFDELYEEFLVMQNETREYEAYFFKVGEKRYRIRYYMRQIYDSSKDVLYSIKTCEELKHRSRLLNLNADEYYKKMTSIYQQLCSILINKDNDKYILIKCKDPDYFLEQFIKYRCIALRNGGIVKRNAEYAIPRDMFSNGMVPKEYSVRVKGLAIESDIDAWWEDIT